ncbi:MAG: glutamate synthase subunit alpha [Acidimicrobiia bacterium]|nr:glutamate synthase subunit alpha [Acidimicrobiia bacterium]
MHRSPERDACGIGFVAHSGGVASRDVLDRVLEGLASVKHRGALAADEKSSDGAGVLVPLNKPYFRGVAEDAGIVVPTQGLLGVATVFADDPGTAGHDAMRRILEAACAANGLTVYGWRDVPVTPHELGDFALATQPHILHLVFGLESETTPEEAECRAYVARREAEQAALGVTTRMYVASMSFRTVNYKALCPGDALARFYPDLTAKDFAVPFGIFHMRFSTNTAPSWERAQPFRMLCHNGEINAIGGNERRMLARARLGWGDRGVGVFGSRVVGAEKTLQPVLDHENSDSGKLDSAAELLVRGGRGLDHGLAMLVPEAWEAVPETPPAVRDFFRYHACLMEPWDGPAGVIATDGTRVVACLDRNGLRPLRWAAGDNGLVMACSEAGAVDLSDCTRVRRGRLGPGMMLVVDPASGLQLDRDVKARLGARSPYGRWIEDGIIEVPVTADAVEEVREEIELHQARHGWTSEDVTMVVKAMVQDAKEPTFAMGDDTPLPLFGTRHRPVHHYLKQAFAQVTNPPIDHLRERSVMSLRTRIGRRDPLLWERPEAARLMELPSFFIRPHHADQLESAEESPFPSIVIDTVFDARDGAHGLRASVERIAEHTEAAAVNGAVIIVLRDRVVADDDVPVPMLLAVGAAQHRLVAAGRRSNVAIVCDTDEVRDTHHLATLLGYGADLICPRLVLETVTQMADDSAFGDPVTGALAQERLQAAMEDGVLKITSKMGISTLSSYRGAQIFEAIGLGPDVIDLSLRGTPSIVGGADWRMLGEGLVARHAAAMEQRQIVSAGLVRHRKGGEYHANNPEVIEVLHGAIGLDTDRRKRRREGDAPAAPEPHAPAAEESARRFLQAAIRTGDVAGYRLFSELVNGRSPTEVHDMLEPVAAAEPVPLDEVEPVEAICRRFTTGAMSHGALSREAHETLAIGMNMVGGRSNCGEGGEAAERFATRGDASDRNSRIKQIASGRFGVTPSYCVHADELQIKMAQGSKPGEGGQIPGHKVTEEIAALRRTQPGVTLISPPPHHDIYSIEDLAQLIFDLKQVNGEAAVSVKLVALSGVGQVAAGVAKGLAEGIHISGCTGGTGASPLSSIKHAGMPWSLGLAETQRVLMENGLRGRVRLSADGGFKTGRDVIIAALLGADEYSFGTAALLAEGCIMVRACHRDTCPTGIATQRENLRAKFAGTPEGVAQYMRWVAEEVRGWLAHVGLRSLDEAIGRVDLLHQRVTGDERADSVDLTPLLAPLPAGPPRFEAGVAVQKARSELGDRLLADAFRGIWDGDDVELEYEITNRDRTVGAALAGAIALEFGESWPPGQVTVTVRGSAGQSFGAFLSKGIDFRLVGEANDYVGKAMAGGRIVVSPPADDVGEPCLLGNTVLYGATGGELFCAGAAGERFAVRTSGAVAVVEGVGQHCAEYMTGGALVILGPVGPNLGAGMTGGVVHVHDPDHELSTRVNRGLVDVVRPDWADLEDVRHLVERHAVLTESAPALALLRDWETTSQEFWMVVPQTAVHSIELTQTETVPQAS